MNIELYLNEVERLYEEGYKLKKAIEIVKGWVEDEYRRQSKSKAV